MSVYVYQVRMRNLDKNAGASYGWGVSYIKSSGAFEGTFLYLRYFYPNKDHKIIARSSVKTRKIL
jgi:hypothetical protein